MTTPESIAQRQVWPETPEARKTEWRRRLDAYLGSDYSDAELKLLGAFQATDTAGRVIHETRRIGRAPQFVTDVCAAALGGVLSMELVKDADARMTRTRPVAADEDAETVARRVGNEASADAAGRLAHGLEVWRRSDVDDRAEEWGRLGAAVGDMVWEITKDADGAFFAPHSMHHVDVRYDRWNRYPTWCRICFDFVEPTGKDGADEKHTYERILTPTMVKTRIDGGKWEERSHPLGVVPIVHFRFRGLHDPCISLHAAHGLEVAQAALDSIATQLIVIGGRTANPWLVIIGAMIAGADDPAVVGKIMNLPTGADAKWLETALTGLSALNAGGESMRARMEREAPEYLFVDSGANSSGLALSYRAGAFKQRIEPVQRRFANALAKAVALCVALDENRAYDRERDDVFVVQTGPALPEDRAALAELLLLLVEGNMLRTVDAVAALQAAGVVPADVPADVYLAELTAEGAARHATNAQRARDLGMVRADDERPAQREEVDGDDEAGGEADEA